MTNDDCYLFGYELDGSCGGKVLGADLTSISNDGGSAVWQHIDYPKSTSFLASRHRYG